MDRSGEASKGEVEMPKRRIRGGTPELQTRARELRREQTPAERLLWNGLRGWRVGKFRRQHPIGRFILDFYCPSARLCIEVDGSVHDAPGHAARDQQRSEALASLGIHVIRFRNEEVLGNPRSVLRRIKAEVALRTWKPMQTSPLPLVGEGGEP